MKNDKIEIKEKELEDVNGGVIPVIYAHQPEISKGECLDISLENKVPTVEPVPFKPDKSKKDKLVPIPY